MFAAAVDLLLDFTGLLSFGHAAFWGSAAYVSGLIALHTGLPFPVAVLGGALFAAALAVNHPGFRGGSDVPRLPWSHFG